MNPRSFAPKVFVAATLLLAAGFATAPSASLAQDASGTPEAGETMAAHPVHIHSGTCETLGDVVFPLTDLAPSDMMGTPMAGMESTPMAGMQASPVTGMASGQMADMGQLESQSSSTIEVALADILAAEHAINAHMSAEEIGVYIACGDITGAPDGDQLEIALAEDSDSGLQGMAILMDNGDGTTTVDVMLYHSDMGMMGTPEATPTS